MEVIKFLSEAKRMCDNTVYCTDCGFYKECGREYEQLLNGFNFDGINKLVKTVERWSEGNPKHTCYDE